MYEYAPTLVPASRPLPPGRAMRPLPSFSAAAPAYSCAEPTERIDPLPRPAARPQPAPRPRPRRLLKLTVGIVVATAVIVGAVLGGLWFVQQRDAVPAATAVGTCIARTGADGIAAVSCRDAAAQYKVISRVDGRTQRQAPAACAGVEGATTTYWEGATGSTGTVLCLGPVAG